jgi:RNA recognition motif-containing protein
MVLLDSPSMRRRSLEKKDNLSDKRVLCLTHVSEEYDKDFLIKVFSTCGNVMKLDLPVDETGHRKGIAFVEYETNEQLRRALETFGTPNDDEPPAPPSYKNALMQPGSDSQGGGLSRSSTQDTRRDEFQAVMRKEGSSRQSIRRNSKEKLDRNQIPRENGHHEDRNSKFKESYSHIGRAVPDVSYEMVNQFKSNTKRNSHDSQGYSYRPRLHLESERALFVPVRNPIGPTQGAKGFAAGRGKLISK